jgi:hypothetical protein
MMRRPWAVAGIGVADRAGIREQRRKPLFRGLTHVRIWRHNADNQLRRER